MKTTIDDLHSLRSHTGPICHFARSQGEVAQILGVTRQYIFKVERRIVQKLRLAMLDELAEENPELCLRVIAEQRRRDPSL